VVQAQPATARSPATVQWRAVAELLGRELAQLAPRAAVEAGPGPVHGLLALGPRRRRSVEQLLGSLRELGRSSGAVIGVSELREAAADAPRAQREATDAATIASALLGDGGAIAYSEVGAYRYLVHIAAGDAPRDRMREAVDLLIDYDRRRRSSLLDTLERYLSERRSVIESSRALYIHPNTLRQRLGRIEELTGLDLDHDDLLSLELAIKLARLHGRPAP
ncbi:MAG: PucR family transcriptional regulator, partial [Solirubrobacteraceae bacterium]